eukprot:131660-Ditylum_brightwellii.AAC.2
MAYRVCDNTLASAGPSTCWMQQWGHSKKKGVAKPNPCQQFLTDLAQELEELQNKGHYVVLSFDANKDLAGNRAFKKFVNETDLVDAYKHMHSTSEPTTYLSGNKGLDCLLITPGLIPALKEI